MSNLSDKNKIYLGVDWGEARIGLALGDGAAKVAVPFKTVKSAAEVLRTVEEEDVGAVVLGEPVKMSGRGGQENGGYAGFLSFLKKNLHIPIIMADERLSSKAADALMKTRKKKAPRDEVAAMLILQGYFDRI